MEEPVGGFTNVNGVTVYTIDETSSPVVSRRVDMSAVKVKTSLDEGSQPAVNPSATHSMVDAHMLKRQMQMLSRLKGYSVIGPQATSEGDGMAAASTISLNGSLEKRVI